MPPKKALDWDEQVNSIGLKMTTSVELPSHLKSKNYYRLSGYWFHMRTVVSGRTNIKAKAREVRSDVFRSGHSFDQVLAIYQWDARFRELLFRAIADVEIGLRTQVSYVLAQRDPFAHRHPDSFAARFSKKPSFRSNLNSLVRKRRRRRSDFQQWQKKVENSIEREIKSDDAIAHQIEKYGDVHIWSIVEILEFWQVIVAFDHLHQSDADVVLSFFKSSDRRIFSSQMAAVNSLRNKIAHHSRIWNRNLERAPALPKGQTDNYFDGIPRDNQISHYRVYPVICTLARWLDSIDSRNTWRCDLLRHLEAFPQIEGYSLSSGGFPPGWQKLPIWKDLESSAVSDD